MNGNNKTADEMRKSLGESGGIERLTGLFDAGTFTELGAYLKRRPGQFENAVNEPEGVRGGFGAVNGELVFAVSQDKSRQSGALTSASAKKFTDIVSGAISKSAPLVAFFDSTGVSVKEGPEALSGMAKIIAALSGAAGIIPTVAVIDGSVTGTNAVIAESFDIKIKTDRSFFAVTPESLQGDDAKEAVCDFTVKDIGEATALCKKLLPMLPYGDDFIVSEEPFDLNASVDEISVKKNGIIDPKKYAEEISDNHRAIEYRAGDGAVYCSFIHLNSRPTALLGVGTAENRKLCAKDIKKAADFIKLITLYDMPLLTLVNCKGFAACKKKCFASHAATLGALIADIASPTVTLITGAAYGAAFTFFASKSLLPDITYALPDSGISALSPEATVEFLSSAMDKTPGSGEKEKLAEAWKKKAASPLYAAECGEIDDIVDLEDSRRRISAAFEMLS